MKVDFHTHILPGMDDGSASVEDSVRMLQQELQQGIEVVFLTPHFYAQQEYPETFLRRRTEALERLQLAMPQEQPKLILGAEVAYYPGMSQWKQLPLLTLGNSPYLLVEMPSAPWTEGMYQELESIHREQRLIPVLAHVERYLVPWERRKILMQLEQLPVLLQANGSFFLNKRTRRLALRLLKSQQIHLLGSDCHSTLWRAPELGQTCKLIAAQLGQQVLDDLAQTEQAVLQYCEKELM